MTAREGLDGGWWRAPRWLVDELIDGRLTITELALVDLVASRREAETGREGWATTLEQLVAILGSSDKTVRRALKRATARGLLLHNLRQGQRHPFRTWMGPRLSGVGVDDFGHHFGHEEGGVVTEVTSVTTSATDETEESWKAFREEGSRAGQLRSPLRHPRAGAHETETETETEKELEEEERARASGSTTNAGEGRDAHPVGEGEAELAVALAPLERVAGGRLNGPGRAEAARAFEEAPDGVRLVAEDCARIASAGGSSNPRGLFVKRIKDGEHRTAAAAERARNAPRQICPECELSPPHHSADCSLAATPIEEEGTMNGRPAAGEEGFVAFVKAAYRAGRITHDDLLERLRLHGVLLRALRADEAETLAELERMGEYVEEPAA